jgi:hypothetical protein
MNPRSLALLGLLALAGCDKFDRPNRALPAFEATGLDGSAWNRDRLAGRPFVVNLWVPG